LFEHRKKEIHQIGFDGSDNEAYEESHSSNEDDFEVTSQDSEDRDRAFYGDDYKIEEDSTNLMSLTMQ